MTDPERAELTPEILQSLAQRLRDRRAELGDHLRSRLREDARDRESEPGADTHDTKDTAFMAAVAEVLLAGANRGIEELRDIEAALHRMHGGVYGICSDCGTPIPTARLEAWPTAKRCRDCQTRYEGSHRR